MRSTLDFTPYRQSWIGFDHLFDMLENTASQIETGGFPPFDLEQEGEDVYRIRLAVAGFTRNDIEITAQPNMLVITGRRQETPEGRYLYRGIAAQPFQRQFQLADHVVVTGARLNDGLLEVELKREIPDAIKPRKIEIGTSAAPKKVEHVSRRRGRPEATGNRENGRAKQEILDAPPQPATVRRKEKESAFSGAW